MQRFVISTRVCRACEVSIKRCMEKKEEDNGEVYKLRKTFAVFHLFVCVVLEALIGRLGCGWMLSAVVGGHYIPMPPNKPQLLTYLG